jgi:chromosome segregation ATPase
MATERWDDERLDRLADLVSSITVQNQNQGQRIEEAIELSHSNFRLIAAIGQQVQGLSQQIQGIGEQVQGLSKQVQALTGQVESLGKKVDETANVANGNARAIQAMADAIAEAAQERREIMAIIAQQQSEVRGLQTENNRMWEYLTGRRNEDDNPDTP